MRAMIPGIIRWFVQKVRAERAFQQLAAMDQRTLKDVGLDSAPLRMIAGLEPRI